VLSKLTSSPNSMILRTAQGARRKTTLSEDTRDPGNPHFTFGSALFFHDLDLAGYCGQRTDHAPLRKRHDSERCEPLAHENQLQERYLQ
jgi:hypothetical protein